MGLAKVLLGRGSKESGLSRYARVDSLGLARRRLAAKAAQEEADIDTEWVEAGEGAEGELAPSAQVPLEKDDQCEPVAKSLSTVSLQHRDSLRIHRRRFKERASLDLSNMRPNKSLAVNGPSWSSGASPFFRAAVEGQDDEADGDEIQHERTSCPTNGSRHVRFRRASDGEYLASTRAHKAREGGFPNAFKAVQLKAERLFKRLTANFTESLPARPRSASHSRGGSPTRPQRSSASRPASVSRLSAPWALGLRHRGTDVSSNGGGDDEGAEDCGCVTSPASPAAAPAAASGSEERSSGGAAAASRQRRSKRQSAPGELFFTPIVGMADVHDPASPPLVAVGRPRANSVTKAGADGVLDPAGAAASSIAGGNSGKSRNWLARISRSLTSTTAYKAMPGGGDGGGGSGGAGDATTVVAATGVKSPPTSPPGGRRTRAGIGSVTVPSASGWS